MSNAVRELKRLRVVHFEDCLMRTEGAKALAAALEAGHESLEELWLGYNEIRVEGGLAALNAVVRKGGLRKVDLNGEGDRPLCAECAIGQCVSESLHIFTIH